MLAAGEWRPTAAAENPHTIGFHISALYSPVGWLSWEQIARDWEAAQGKAEDLETFRNTVLGETWQDRGEAPDTERLVERREDFRLGVVAQDALVLTAGVDVQDDDGWNAISGPGLRVIPPGCVDHIVIAGSPRERAPGMRWRNCWRGIGRGRMAAPSASPRPALIPAGATRRRSMAICGGCATRALRRPRVWMVGTARSRSRARRPVDALVDGRKLRRGLKLRTVSVSTWKVDLYRRLWLGRGEAAEFPPGWVHLPQGIEVEWVKQLVAEQLRTGEGPARLCAAGMGEAAGAGMRRWIARCWRARRCGCWARIGMASGSGNGCARISRMRRWKCQVTGGCRRRRSDQARTPPPLMRRPGWLAPRGGWLR
jgi:hypothetical protein